MARRKTQTLTPLELEIMKVLWEIGSGNVQSVVEALPGERLAYTTVQTMLNLLLAKGKVKRTLKDRAYIYKPTQSRTQAVGQTMKDLIDRMFGGSTEALVMGLLETRQLTPDVLERVQRKLAEAKKDAQS
jgi:BlaI family transcriptional regulator, penicillinase repressor